jgi:mannose-6-phosphate isomerase-like protein (cupin superfamily)
MTDGPIIFPPLTSRDDDGGLTADGKSMTIAEWPTGPGKGEVGGLHVHYSDDEAWYVISGAMHFHFADREIVARAGSTVFVPAGVAHTFGNAGPEPSRFLIIMPARLAELVAKLHEVDTPDRAALWKQHDSELLEP